MGRKDNVGHEGYYRIMVHGYSPTVASVLGEDNIKLVENGAKRGKLYILFLPPGTSYKPGKPYNVLKPKEYYAEEFTLPSGEVIVCTTLDTSFEADVKDSATVKRGTYERA